MFITVLRKMLRNKWMVLCLVIGSVLAVATISSMPIYSNSIMQRMLQKDLQSYQQKNNVYPGRYLISQNLTKNGQDYQTGKENLDHLNETVNMAYAERLGIPVQLSLQRYESIPLQSLVETHLDDISYIKKSTLTAYQDFWEHITLVSGELPSNEKSDGYYEVVISQNAADRLGLVVGSTAVLTPYKTSLPSELKVKVTGVFNVTDVSDLYWYRPTSVFTETMVMDFDLFARDFVNNADGMELVSNSQWYFALDYTQMKVGDSGNYSGIIAAQQKELSSDTNIDAPMTTILSTYTQRMGELSITLWILQVPILMMLVFYIFMVSQLLVDYDRNDIAVYKSRGASNLQIFNNYVSESAIIGIIALLIGPLLGFVICKVLGLSNGFLEFVSRSGMQTEMVPDAYLYGLLAVAVFMGTMLIPVIMASRTNIVKLKRTKSRNTNQPLWQKFFLDFILLGVSVYGLVTYYNRLELAQTTGVASSEASIDPLLFLLSTLFILAVGLIFLRLYPLLVKLIFWIGKKHWSPSLYASLINVSRGKGQSRFLMLFLILTISLGLFNTMAARTLNTFTEDQIKYANGADIVIQPVWHFTTKYIELDAIDAEPGTGGGEVIERQSYTEPPFAPYTELDGVELATKVFKEDMATVKMAGSNDKAYRNVELMGIIPYEFGQLTWSRSDLLPTHINNYLNLMTENPRAVFISRSLAEASGIAPGDEIDITWDTQNSSLDCVVYGVIDYWPSINPEKQQGEQAKPQFIIANLNLIHSQMSMEPYEIWMKKSDGATSTQIYEQMIEEELFVESMKDTDQEIIAAKNDPMLQGTNGTLTLGFIITMTVSFIGFLIYWIFNIRNRTLQFGILRAMGLPKKKLIGMIIAEQLLISGSAIVAGVLIGTLASSLYVPLLQVVYSPAEQVPPFMVVSYLSDYLRMFIILLVMLIIGCVVLGVLISKIKMDQALKLGED